jgi:predicted ATP-dependent serine protease
MAEVVQLAEPGPGARVRGSIAITESAQDTLRSAQLVSSEFGGAITLIAAAPGTGKSKALMRFTHGIRKDALWHTAVKSADDTPLRATTQLMETLDIGRPNNRCLRGLREQIGEAIGVDGLLIIDEAKT